MVCQRCVMVVSDILKQHHLPYTELSIGRLEVRTPFSPIQIKDFNTALMAVGFNIIENKTEQIIEDIKARVRSYITAMHQRQSVKLSTFITQKVFYDYTYLSDLFSQLEQKTIEQYFLELRLEKVKEELKYDHNSIATIAYILGFSSPQHLTQQFKQLTGITPSQFRRHINYNNPKFQH